MSPSSKATKEEFQAKLLQNCEINEFDQNKAPLSKLSFPFNEFDLFIESEKEKPLNQDTQLQSLPLK
jgi:hypothetical protein